MPPLRCRYAAADGYWLRRYDYAMLAAAFAMKARYMPLCQMLAVYAAMLPPLTLIAAAIARYAAGHASANMLLLLSLSLLICRAATIFAASRFADDAIIFTRHVTANMLYAMPHAATPPPPPCHVTLLRHALFSAEGVVAGMAAITAAAIRPLRHCHSQKILRQARLRRCAIAPC